MRAEMRRLVIVEGCRIQTVARRFRVHHSVVRRAIRDSGMGARAAPSSALDTFKPYIVKRIIELPALTSVRLFGELKGRGFKIGLAQLRRYVAQVRPPRLRKAYLRVEFEPGEQAQVDWGSFGFMRTGSGQRPLSVFSMVMSWSRAIFIDFSLDQQMATFLRMHRRALAFFGGVPKRIVYDNLKSVVLHHVGSTVQFNPRFLAFAGHYLFEATAAPVRYPEYKGRVESSIKYIRHSFFYGRSFSSIDDVALRLPLGATAPQTSVCTAPRASVRRSACSSSAPAFARCPSTPSTPTSSSRSSSRRRRASASTPIPTRSRTITSARPFTFAPTTRASASSPTASRSPRTRAAGTAAAISRTPRTSR
jgi:transposase